MIPLDSIQHITRGSPLTVRNIFSEFNPTLDQTTIIYESENSSKNLLGQVFHEIGAQSSQLTYLIADQDDDPAQVATILEDLCRISAEWGAYYVMADLDIESPFLKAFRCVDFNIWAKQHLWQIPLEEKTIDHYARQWRVWQKEDINAMRSLYQCLVPKIFHNLEPLKQHNTLGLLYQNNESEIKGYVDLVYGPKGIWALPMIHPDCADDPEIIINMLKALPKRGKRPVSICIRSYQPWLDDLMQRLDAFKSSEQVLLVKYMAVPQRVSATLDLAELKNGRADKSLPVAHIKSK